MISLGASKDWIGFPLTGYLTECVELPSNFKKKTSFDTYI